jgi:hypothetical protein
MKLSPTQLEVLHKLAAGNEPLIYFKGGYWTTPSLGQKSFVPWHVTFGTVRSLEKLGLLVQTGTSANYSVQQYPNLSDRVLTKKGFAAIS